MFTQTNNNHYHRNNGCLCWRNVMWQQLIVPHNRKPGCFWCSEVETKWHHFTNILSSFSCIQIAVLPLKHPWIFVERVTSHSIMDWWLSLPSHKCITQPRWVISTHEFDTNIRWHKIPIYSVQFNLPNTWHDGLLRNCADSPGSVRPAPF